MEPTAIAHNVCLVQTRIERAARRVGRDPLSIRLVAVTKSVDADRIRVALNAGVRIIGENRLQEALPKIEALRSCGKLTWHFIGQLQRRKVKTVVGQFDMIESVDSVELAIAIQRSAEAAGVTQSVLLEVNISGEPCKAGFSPEALSRTLPEFQTLSHVAVKGLMTIPPRETDAESSRPYFRQLRELADALRALRLRHIEMSELSMGMSQDFEVAVEEGATFVRVGTAIFGARDV